MLNDEPKIAMDRNTLHDYEKAITLEWLVTNGLGGYSSSTVLGINTRKYHGLLVSSFNSPVDRRVMLAKLDEQIRFNDQTFLLGANEFHQIIHPQGHKHLERFQQATFPRFHYNMGPLSLTKTILMPYKKNSTVVSYAVSSSLLEEANLCIFPLTNSRHFHSITKKTELEPNYSQITSKQRTKLQTVRPESTLILSASLGEYVTENPTWIERIFFRNDSSEGTSCFDDCFIPGRFEIPVNPSSETQVRIVASAAKSSEAAESSHEKVCGELEDFETFCRKEASRTSLLREEFHRIHDGGLIPARQTSDWLDWLVSAANSFIVDRASTMTKTVIAGYHWFEDWGRDSLISLPGLTLVTGRFNDAREILLTFSHYCKAGIIPNRFPDREGDEPAYNTVDATLWYFNAVLQYLKYTGDFQFVQKKLWTSLQSVIDHHIQGTINDIRLESDGLIAHGPQLTWMDAMTDNTPVTPRHGKAVEIQALWYNALKTMVILANHFGLPDLAHNYEQLSRRAAESFHKFWDNERNCLLDVINNEKKETGTRPNQIFAVCLDFSMLTEGQRIKVVAKVHEKLWTKYGLKTLSSDDPKFRGRYCGNPNERNTAYHNGTIWPWLIGPFVTAFTRIRGFSEASRTLAYDTFLLPLFAEQIRQAGLGSIGEIFDGDPPHFPRGCISQAWSVAEPLRAYVEDICLHRGEFESVVLEKAFNDETK
jgi:predicted glycogen debranching enzyme